MNKVAVIGSLNMDVLVEVDEFPNPGQTVMAKSIDYKAGGKGVNQAAAAAAVGASTILIGNVGEDAFGQQIIAKINQMSANFDNLSKKYSNLSFGKKNTFVILKKQKTVLQLFPELIL